MKYKHTALVFLVLLSVTGSLFGHQPPTHLSRVGDHWTAWDPPVSFPEGADVYTVGSGDTLWDLADRFYGDPYLWPQLWERNRYILDAHWIYPGDPLLVSMQVTPIGDIAAATDEAESSAGEDDEGGLRLDRSREAPEPLGFESDIYCSGFIDDLDLTFEREVIGSEFQALMPSIGSGEGLSGRSQYGARATVKVDLTTGDVIYLDGGMAAGLTPGMIFAAIAPREPVTHPVSGQTMGRFYRFSGRVRVLSVQEESAIAEITHTCMPINVGDGLRPFEPIPVPLARRGRMVGVNDPVSAHQLDDAPMIIRSEAGIFTVGQDHVVYLDRGSDDLKPGDIFTIYRLHENDLPPVVIGEVGVLTTHENSSVAKVLESRYAVFIGDRLARKH
ncbi:MAG: LysM peptidoglycan-binding domain-containing protein [Acidobacteriota bacterium]|nr:LysM peptidoglycan-binding domain-containing protein [Acidobacteriota bacterium]